VSNARIAATAGWLTLAAILASEVILPSLLIGSPPTGSMDRVAVEAYYAHESLLPLGLVAIATIIGFVVFATALREVLLALGDRAFWANAGFAFALVAAALLLVRTALQMALVRGLASGSDIMPTFFAWDFTYNTALYAMEASYPVAFAMAMTRVAGAPRWLLALGVTVAVLQLVNMTSLVVGLPMAATLPGTLSFVAWFAATAWLVGRVEPMVAASPSAATA
jgi:hypothetical protein